MKIVDNIRKIRIEKGIPQKAIADAMSLNDSAVSNLENGKRDLKVKDLEKIASALDVRVIDLFTWPDRYVKADGDDTVEVTVQIKVKEQTRDEVLKLLVGEENIELLTK